MILKHLEALETLQPFWEFIFILNRIDVHFKKQTKQKHYEQKVHSLSVLFAFLKFCEGNWQMLSFIIIPKGACKNDFWYVYGIWNLTIR